MRYLPLYPFRLESQALIIDAVVNVYEFFFF